ITMVELPVLCEGCVVMLGDAGYCPTFLSGMGASLSLLGAKVLSDAIKSEGGVSQALARYNGIMRPVAAHFQANARSNMLRELPTNAVRAAMFNAGLRIMPLPLITKKVGKQLTVEKQLLAPTRQ